MSQHHREKSEAAFERACQVIPGGVNSPARAFGAVGGIPVFIERAQGQYLYDIDGNRYLDFIGSWGPHILGHRHPTVIAAIESALERSTSFGAPTELESDVADLIVDAVPSIEKVRMVNSGTEATMSAIRLARGYTGRNKIVKFAGCYHGHVDSLLVQAGSGALTLGTPSSPGIPEGCTADTIVLEYNDVSQIVEVFQQQGDQIAAVILELICGNMGVVVPSNEFLQTLRTLCTQHGTVLIADEVMTGFRVAYGGAQSRLGIDADLTTLGKIIGGGMPVGAYGGRSDIMDTVSPTGPVYQAGTLSGNPIAMACGLSTLRILKEENPYPQLEAQTKTLVKGLVGVASARGIPMQVAQAGSMFTLFFNESEVNNFTTATKSNTDRFARYFWGMLERGCYLPCSQYEATFLSIAHSSADIEHTIQSAQDVMQTIA